MSHHAPGRVRDAVENVLRAAHPDALDMATIHQRVIEMLGTDAPRSSVASSLNLRSDSFERVGRGKYRWIQHVE